MKILINFFLIIISNYAYGQIRSDSLFLCKSLEEYVESSRAIIPNNSFDRYVIIVHETDSKYIFSIVANSIDITWIKEIKDCYLTKLSNNYILFVGPMDFKRQWTCLDIIDTNSANILAKLNTNMFNVDNLEYSTFKLPSFTLLK
jgi:hypothetical protein